MKGKCQSTPAADIKPIRTILGILVLKYLSPREYSAKDKVAEQAGEQVLGIWEVGALVADGEGCSYQDLRYIESQLQSILALGK